VASGAGLNRVGARGGEVLLTLSPNSTSLDSGTQMSEAIAMKTWTFQIIGPGAAAAGYTVTLYGTIDPAAYDNVFGRPGPDPVTGAPAVKASGKGNLLVPATSWFALPGPAEQGGTGTMTNPMVSGTSNILQVSMALVAVRAVAVIGTAPAPTLGIQVLGFATP
jgi:hypothetical protein